MELDDRKLVKKSTGSDGSLSDKWSDYEPSPTSFEGDPDIDLFRPIPTSEIIQPKKTSPKPKLTEKEEDLYNAPVIWLKKTFGLSEKELRSLILKTYRDAGQTSVEIVDIFLSVWESRSHAYILLNSFKASQLLIDGSLTVIATVDKDGESEELALWFEKADHLLPKDTQDPYTLYLWELSKEKKGSAYEKALTEKISRWCPIEFIAVDEDEYGNCTGWAKVYLNCEFDTQKCVYMLNFNEILGKTIRASFCNQDRDNAVKKRPQTADRSRKSNPRPANQKIPKKKTSPTQSPVVNENKPKKSSTGWQVVGREGRRK